MSRAPETTVRQTRSCSARKCAGSPMPRMKRARAALTALVAAVAVTACAGAGSRSFTHTPGDPGKPARACSAVDEATPLAMTPADRTECERTMRGWYAETWYPPPGPGRPIQGRRAARVPANQGPWVRTRRRRLPFDRQGPLDGPHAVPHHRPHEVSPQTVRRDAHNPPVTRAQS